MAGGCCVLGIQAFLQMVDKEAGQSSLYQKLVHIKGESPLISYQVRYYRQEDYVDEVAFLSKSFTTVEE